MPTLIKPVRESSIRRAITTLSKAGFIPKSGWNNDDFAQNKVSLLISVDAHLIQPKKKAKKCKTK